MKTDSIDRDLFATRRSGWNPTQPDGRGGTRPSHSGRARFHPRRVGPGRGSTRAEAFWARPEWLLICGQPQSACGHDARKGEMTIQPSKELPIVGEVFSVEGRTAFLILPRSVAASNEMPWVWYAPTLPSLPGQAEKWMFQKFSDAGIAVAGIDVGESYGNPQGCALFSAFYAELVGKRGLSKRPCLLARSRGGLMLYNWAIEHPSFVAGIAGIYPVCDFLSYPGLKNACAAYGLAEALILVGQTSEGAFGLGNKGAQGLTEAQLLAQLAAHNPIDRLASLAEAHVPIYHIHGDCDTVVPLEENSGKLAQRYRQLGGEITLNVVKGQGHNMWPGWFQSQELVDFVIAQAHKR